MKTRAFGKPITSDNFYRLDIIRGQSADLTLMEHQDKGYNQKLMVSVTTTAWNKANFNDRIAQALKSSMDKTERGAQHALGIKEGAIQIPALSGRELAVLMYALAEDDNGLYADPIFFGWSELAREERWWLYTKASGLGQREGAGWRKALFHSLGECHEATGLESKSKKKAKR